MAKRHDDALFAQMGACNPLGVSKGLARAYDEVAAEMRAAGTMDTSKAAKDPACQLILHQLCHLAGIWTKDHERALAASGQAFNWEVAVEQCLREASPEIVTMWNRQHAPAPA